MQSQGIKKTSLLLLVFLILSGCGGGSGGDNSLSGSWSGQMKQASGVNCSDGAFFGAGFGSDTREISLQITGGDLVDESGTLVFDDCTYTGVRESETEMTFVSEEESCHERMALSEIRNGTAQLFIDPRPAVPLADGTQTCVIAEGGEIRRGG